jgi:RHS repeat-associated protein
MRRSLTLPSTNPFGDPLAATGSFDPQLGYQSDWTDPDSGHVWMGARWYDGGWATFLSRDSMSGELSTPVSLNRYTYAWANPLAYWDPTGQYTMVADGVYYGDGKLNKTKTKPKTDAQVERDWLKSGQAQTNTASKAATTTKLVQAGRHDQPHHPVGTTKPAGFFTDLARGLDSTLRGVEDTLVLGPIQTLLNITATASNAATRAATSFAYMPLTVHGGTTPRAPTWNPPNIMFGPVHGYGLNYQVGAIGALALPFLGGAAVTAGASTIEDAAVAADIRISSATTAEAKAAANGETAATSYGRLMHQTWDYGPGFEREFTLASGRRVDAIDFETRQVIELKPNNPRAIRLGNEQLENYISELEDMYPGNPWTGKVVTYDRP